MRFYFDKYASILSVVLLTACNTPQPSEHIDALASNIDTTINPCDDFFDYANGHWFKTHPIPESEDMNGLWQLLQDTIDMQIKNICVSSANETNTPQGSNKQKIGDFFKSGMDSLALNKKGISDILPDIAKIDSINSISDLIQASAYAQIVASSPLFSFYISQDEKMSSKNVIYFEQGGLNLPDREYYFATDSRTTIIRNEYFKYIANLFERIGNNTERAKLAAEHVLKLETALAKSSRKREDTRDPLTNYNNLAFDQWQKTIPNVNIPLFIKSVGLSNAAISILEKIIIQ